GGLRRRVRHRDRAAAPDRHPHRRADPMARGRIRGARRRRGDRRGRNVLHFVHAWSRIVRRVAALGALFTFGVPGVAQAHLIDTRLGDFYGGVLHPLSGFEYALPWLAVAILAGLQGTRHARWVFAVFPLGLLVGIGLYLAVPAFGFTAWVNMGSFAC